MTVFANKITTAPLPVQAAFRFYGNFALAYHTLQPGLDYYQTNEGYIAYKVVGNDMIVLGDPVTSFQNKAGILQSFLAQYGRVSFIQISLQTAFILKNLQYSTTHFGYESTISLPFSLQGRLKKDVRLLYNAARKNNIQVLEIPKKSIVNSKTPLIAGNNNKRSFAAKKEFRFLSRPFTDEVEDGIRIFAAYQGSRLFGFSLFDPIYENNTIVSYAESIIRRSPAAPKGTRTYILIKAMEQFYKEQIPSVSLGLLPFYSNSQLQIPETANKTAAMIFSGLYHCSPLFHNFRGISFHKTRYRGELHPVYFATKNRFPVIELLKIHKLTTGKYL